MHKIAINTLGALLFGLSTSALAISLDAQNLSNSLQKSTAEISSGSGLTYGGQDISLLIIAFAMWGIQSYLSFNGKADVVAKVNGVEITKRQLAMAFEPLRNQAQISNGGVLSPHTQDELRKQALDMLVNIQILKQASVAQKYRVAYPQVDSYIRQMPQFQSNGQFSPSRLQELLAASGVGPNDFIDSVGTTLLIDQPRFGIVFSSFALPNEVKTTIELVNQQRDLRYITIPKEQFLADATVSPEEIQAYYDQHKEDFKTTEQVSLDFIQLSVKDLMKTISISDEAAKKAYDENKSTYSTAAHPQTFEEAKDKIKEDLQKQKAEEIFADSREKLANATYETPTTLDSAAKNLSLTVEHTGLFSKDQGDTDPTKSDITYNKKVRDIAFSPDVLVSQNNSDLIQISPDAAVVVRVKEHQPASVLPLTAVSAKISDMMKTNKAEQKAKDAADQAVADLQKGMSAQEVENKVHGTWNDAGWVGRYDSKVDSAVLYGAFKVAKPDAGKDSFAQVKIPSGYAVIAISGIKDGATDVSQQQEDAFIQQIQNSEAVLEYSSYEKSLVKSSKVVSYLTADTQQQ